MKPDREPTPLPSDSAQLARILEKYLADIEDGRSPSREALLAQHPALAEHLEACLASLDFIGHAAASVRGPNQDNSLPELFGEPLGDFRILRQIGRGGMGIVYDAEQMSLGRHVALKVLPLAELLDQRQLQRFKNEARSAAMLKHAHIVSVYSVGCERGIHYYAMELIDGSSLADVIADLRAQADAEWEPADGGNVGHRILPAGDAIIRTLTIDGSSRSRHYFRSVARIGIQAARALDYAHEMGLVHRDIKPSNLLISGSGHLWVSDFGLAMTQTDANLTMTGDLVGTLRYMSPEQACGRRAALDHRTDIYSLGVTLYELLALRPAFGSQEHHHLLHQIATVDPPVLRKLSRSIPRDLETIVLKAIEKDPSARYDSAAEMARDLERFLERRPIRARRSGPVHRFWNWVKRNPVVAALTGVLVFLLVLLAIAGPMVALKQARARRTAERLLYIADVASAYRAWQGGDIVRAEELLSRQASNRPTDARGAFVWRYLWNRCQLSRSIPALHHPAGVSALAFSLDGRTLATGCDDHVVRLWDNDGRNCRRELSGHFNVVQAVAFSPTDHDVLATGAWDGTVRLWKISSGELLQELSGPSELVKTLSYSSDGTLLAAAGEHRGAGQHESSIRVWDVRNVPKGDAQQLVTFVAHEQPIYCLAFSPDQGSEPVLASGGLDNAVKLWDLSRLPEAPIEPTITLEGHRARILSIAFSPDGKKLASGGWGRVVKLWDVSRRHSAYLEAELPTRIVQAIAYSPDGTLLATGGLDGVVQLWDTRSRARIARLISHTDFVGVGVLRFSPDGRQLVSGGRDRTARIWNVERYTGQYDDREAVDTDWWTAVALPTAGRCFAATTSSFNRVDSSSTGHVFLGNTNNERGLVPIYSDSATHWFCVAFAPDDQWLACGGVRNRPESAEGIVAVAAIQPQQKTLGRVHIFDGHAQRVLSLAYSPTGRVLATGSMRDGVKLWDAETYRELSHFQTGPLSWYALDYSPNGRYLAAGGGEWQDGRVKVWDTRRGETHVTLRHTHLVFSLAFAADGHTLVAGDWGGNVKLWDVRTGQPRAAFAGHPVAVSAMAISPDGAIVASGGLGRTVRLWRFDTGDLLAELPAGFGITSLAFTTDGGILLAGGADKRIRLWRIHGEDIVHRLP